MLSFMTNSRYLREFDFARFDHATRTGLMDFILKRGGSFPVGAVYMRYRLPAMIFSPYKVRKDNTSGQQCNNCSINDYVYRS